MSQAIALAGGDVELVDDGPETAPSKRVLGVMPHYVKTVDGVAVIRDAGLAALMERCQRLRAWVDCLSGAELPDASR